jgi:branched-chain amino acid transport system ATP-binding protein
MNAVTLDRPSPAPASGPGAPLLEVKGLEVAYGHVTAVRGLTLQVHDGEIVALLGSNGAGKTSSLRGITGLVPPRAGRVTFAGRRLETAGPGTAVAEGMAHVPEGRRIFRDLAVADNLALGAWGRGRAEEKERTQLVYDMFPRLHERRTQKAGSLSGGEQQMLAVGRALMSGPRLLLIDELSLGLSPLVTDELLADLVKLNREGLAIVLIEQFVHRALDVANRVYLLAKGQLAFSGTPAEAVRTGAVEAAYLHGGSRC